MKPVEGKPFSVGIDGGDDDAPFGLVFPESLEGDFGDVEGTAPPVGGGGHATTAEEKGGGERESGDGTGKREAEHREKIHIPAAPGDAPGPARAWWCNADFDLTLAHGGGKVPAKILQAARAMAWPMWPALGPRDTLLVPQAAPPGFVEELREKGLAPPRFVVMPAEDDTLSVPHALPSVLPAEAASLRFTPFGWNAAAALNAQSAAPAAHPPLEVVRRVNSRAFGAELERSLCGADACAAAWCPGEKAVRAWLESAAPGRYVAKGNHGSAGIAQLRFELPPALARRPASLDAALKRLAARHGGVVIEEELAVEREWGVLFCVGRDGRRGAVRRHRLLSAAEGGYAGALVLPSRETAAEALFNPHRARALGTVDGVARALSSQGYFGPVGIDMFTYRVPHAPDVVRFRPLVDLNARQSMAWPAHGLATRYPDRAVLFRQFSATMRLQDGRTMSNWTIRDNLSFNPLTRRGALRMTPLLPFARVSWAIIGHDEADVLAQHDALFGAPAS